VRDAPMLNNNS